jgi:hypothetical protein
MVPFHILQISGKTTLIMKILRGLSTDKNHPVTDPFPSKNGFFLEFRGGDFCHPLDNGDWFKPPYFKHVWRFFLRWPLLPFLSWKFGKHGGYIGAKAYGVDSPDYKNWLPEDEVYDGSEALMIGIRPHANLDKQ